MLNDGLCVADEDGIREQHGVFFFTLLFVRNIEKQKVCWPWIRGIWHRESTAETF